MPDGVSTATNAIMGSPQYMSPEQVRSSRNVDARTDVWALGTVLYELLTGQMAFQGDSFGALFDAILNNPHRPLRELRPDLPPEMETVISRVLAKDVAARMQTVAELVVAIARFAPPSTAPEVERICRLAGTTPPSIRPERWEPPAVTPIAVRPSGSMPVAGVSPSAQSTDGKRLGQYPTRSRIAGALEGDGAHPARRHRRDRLGLRRRRAHGPALRRSAHDDDACRSGVVERRCHHAAHGDGYRHVSPSRRDDRDAARSHSPYADRHRHSGERRVTGTARPGPARAHDDRQGARPRCPAPACLDTEEESDPDGPAVARLRCVLRRAPRGGCTVTKDASTRIRPRQHRSTVVAAAIAIAMSSSTFAFAQSKAGASTARPLAETLTGEAKNEYEAGRVLFGAEDFSGAAFKMQRAYDVSKEPRLLWNIAACEKRLRHYARVMPLVERYLADASSLITAAQVAEAQEVLTAMRPFVSKLTVNVDQPEAELSVDGAVVGTTPATSSVLVDMGPRVVRVTKDGFRPWSETRNAPGASELVLDIHLLKDVHEGRLLVIAGAHYQIEIRRDGAWHRTGQRSAGERLAHRARLVRRDAPAGKGGVGPGRRQPDDPDEPRVRRRFEDLVLDRWWRAARCGCGRDDRGARRQQGRHRGAAEARDDVPRAHRARVAWAGVAMNRRVLLSALVPAIVTIGASCSSTEKPRGQARCSRSRPTCRYQKRSTTSASR